MSIPRHPNPCSFDGCEKPSRALTLCWAHYTRKRRGTLDKPDMMRPAANAAEYIAMRITVDDSGCWIWQTARDADGYGSAYFQGRRWRAHRLSYTTHVGEIPAELQIDHLCRVRACVNPEHLEAVTSRENTRRGESFMAECMRNPKPSLVPDAPEGHGTIGKYSRGCRCNFCREANRLYVREYKQRKGYAVGPEKGPYKAVREGRPGVVH